MLLYTSLKLFKTLKILVKTILVLYNSKIVCFYIAKQNPLLIVFFLRKPAKVLKTKTNGGLKFDFNTIGSLIPVFNNNQTNSLLQYFNITFIGRLNISIIQ